MFGKRLKELRKKHSLTQASLGKKLGLSPSAIGMYEQGNREPDHYILLKICDLFNVSADYMINSNLKCSIFFNPDEEHDLGNLINMFSHALTKPKNISYKNQKLEPNDVQKVIDSIKLAISCTLAQEGF